MKDKHIQKECTKHGLTKWSLAGTRGRYRCAKCLVAAVTKRRHKIKLMAVAHLGGKCQKCGYCTYIGALDFHHKDPEHKDFSIGQNGYTRAWDTVKKEIEKCLLLCKNCHCEEHERLRIVG